ncbi:MAG: PTS sugar transporter subunit IIA [Opitutales bacterium]
MRLDRYIAKSRVIDLESNDLRGALQELLEVCKLDEVEGYNQKKALDELVAREQTMTTYLGNGVALPHLRLNLSRPYIFAMGRCPQGLDFDGQDEYRELRVILLLLARENEKSYLNVLASLARIFQEKNTLNRLLHAEDLAAFREQVSRAFSGGDGQSKTKDNKFNRLILREAGKIARGANCTTVLIFGDTFAGGIDLGNVFGDLKTVLVTQSATDASVDNRSVSAALPVRSFSNNRLSQLRSAVLIGLTRGIFKHNERLLCVGGIPQSNQFDLIVVVDVEREFQSIFTRQTDVLPEDVRPETLERVLGIATELAVEGREGRPVGALFVLGDSDNVRPYAKQLVLNPFFGYKDEDRNVLNPFMDETVKELSSIDGAFIIRGDGVLESAGALIHAPDYTHTLPSGLGSRHAAAAAISLATDAVALVVSASNGQVSLFRRGQLLPVIERNVGRNL